MVKICPKCNKRNKDTSIFCEECGTTLPTSKASKETKNTSGGVMDFWNKQSSRSKVAIGIGGICCIGLILIIGLVAMATPDVNYNNTTTDTNATTDTNTTPDTTTDTTPTTTDTSTDEFSGLNNPSEVESVLSQYDYNGDNKIEFLDSYSTDQDGQEEYAYWAVSAGYDPSDSAALTGLFNKYDTNGDYYWDIYELDRFYDDYYKNN